MLVGLEMKWRKCRVMTGIIALGAEEANKPKTNVFIRPLGQTCFAMRDSTDCMRFMKLTTDQWTRATKDTHPLAFKQGVGLVSGEHTKCKPAVITAPGTLDYV